MSIQSLHENEKEVQVVVLVCIIIFEINIYLYLMLLILQKKNDLEADVQKNSTENEFCIIQCCDKTFLKDGQKTLFFK